MAALASRVQILVCGVTDVLTLLREREGTDAVLAAHAGVARHALDNLLFELRKSSRKAPTETASGAASTSA
jgi:hypothetical protein